MTKKIQVGCEMEVTLKMIGGKCKPLILYILAEEGTLQLWGIVTNIRTVSQKTLTNQLGSWKPTGSSCGKPMRRYRLGWNIL